MRKIIICALVFIVLFATSVPAFANETVTSNNVVLPNPMKEYSTLAAAKAAIGFDAWVPSVLPKGYELRAIHIIDNKILDLEYKHGTSNITYRTAQGSKDISGDYNKISMIGLLVNGVNVTVKGTGKSISSATWTVGNYSFALSFSSKTDLATLKKIIGSIEEQDDSMNNPTPNPVKEYANLSDAKRGLPFNPIVPKSFVKGYKRTSISVIDGDLLQLEYSNRKYTATYRTALGNENISGDYSKYAQNRSYYISGIVVSVSGRNNMIYVANWTSYDISYALHFDRGISKSALSSIVKDIVKQEKAATGSAQVQLPNPLIEYPSVEQAKSVLSFKAKTPTIPAGHRIDTVIVIGGTLLDIRYKSGENIVCYRTAAGSENISGDYNTYSQQKSVTIAGMNVIIKGNSNSISVATWTVNNTSYSLSFSAGTDENTLKVVMESIR